MHLNRMFIKKNLSLPVLMLIIFLLSLSSSPAQEVKYTKESVHIKLDLLPKDQLPGEFTSYLSRSINFTGKAEVDFNIPGAIVIHDPGNIANNGRDVFIESPPADSGTCSGWDMKTIYMYYNKPNDIMYVGVHVFTDPKFSLPRTIFGDADGNDDPGGTSSWLRKMQGTDTLDLKASEAFVLLIDTDNDGVAQAAIGVNQSTDIHNFAIHEWAGLNFKYPYDGEFWGNKIADISVTNPSSNRPDLEFGIDKFSELWDSPPGPTLEFQILAFAGSDEDAGIGDDYIPDKISPGPVSIYYSDFGDAPIPYPTLFNDDGAYHDTSFNLYLGYKFEPDSNGYPSIYADGDDRTGIDDEDGVVQSQLILYEGTTPKISVLVKNETQQKAFIVGWIDYNGNKKWEDAEKTLDSTRVSGNVILKFPPVSPDTVKTTYARFRISTNFTSVNKPTGKAPDGEVEDYRVEIKRIRDFGDTFDDPSNANDYPTLLLSNGAFHSYVPNPVKLKLGLKIDNELDGQPSIGAINDDLNGIDDEDIFSSNIIKLIEGRYPTLTFKVLNNTGDSATVNGWIDFNGNQQWEPSEKATDKVATSTVYQNVTLSFSQPAKQPPDTTYARFRISAHEINIDEPFGWAPDGEVEDYQVVIEKYDFGDAPDDSNNSADYPTYFKSGGAHHKIVTGFFLGTGIDNEADGQPHPGALGDMYDDGVVFHTEPLIAGGKATIEVTASLPGKLDAWIDFNNDYDWADPGEQIFAAQSLLTGKTTLTFPVPHTATSTLKTFARFRFSSSGNLPYHGPANDGEVEDYKVPIIRLDFGDGPENLGYPTLNKNNGARHEIASTSYDLYLAEQPDHEGDGLPTLAADGDDNTNTDDENGAGTKPIQLTAGSYPQIKLTVVNTSEDTATVNGWIDFNVNGAWEPQEKASENVLPGPNPQTIKLNFLKLMPDSIKTTYARFRISTDSDSIFYPTGFAPDGEVEDYLVKVVTLYDYGDAPDPQYPTLLSSEGARHKFLPDMKKVCLGNFIDYEADGLQSEQADGDDNTEFDDEDGLVVGDIIYLTVGDTPHVKINVFNETGKTVYVTGWIDYDDSESWDLDERDTVSVAPNLKRVEELALARDVPIPKLKSTVTLNFPKVPLTAPAKTYARFRVSTDSASISNPKGIAPDGEVEDYLVIIDRYDFGDAPDDSMNPDDYPTYELSDGARHKINPDLYFGKEIDHEVDGQPDSTATGDDTTGIIDDEDIFPWNTITLNADSIHQIEIPVFNNTGQEATVVGWIDYDKNGNWEEHEKADTTIVGSGTVTLIFKNTPQNVTISTYARFRISTVADSIASPDGLAPDGEVEDYKVKIIALDFGDAPDDSANGYFYSTLSADTGACHIIKSGFYLGPIDNIDFEADGQPTIKADGDDLNGINDEKGVTFHRMPLMVCSPETVTVIASKAGKLDAWIDFNNNNRWDKNDKIFNSQPLMAGPNDLIFQVPCDAIPDSQTYARFRFSSKGGLSYKYLAEDGEVEDYPVKIDGFDFGDAPDDPQNSTDYPTFLVSNGAYHKIKTGFHLGKYIDPEFDGQPNDSATGDDNDSFPDDEDGVYFKTSFGDSTDTLVVCQQAQIIVTASRAGGKLDAWIDYNNDRDWDDPGEKIFSARDLISGQNTLTFTVPCTAKATPRTFARFRYSSKGGLSYDGPADNGEVEDYAISIIALDFGDAPDDTTNRYYYPTLSDRDGARHIIKPGFYLGTVDSVDCEGDGQPDPNAKGDDNKGFDDEEGVKFSPMPLIIGKTDTVTVTASEKGMLDAWIDFYDDGDWDDPGEQIFNTLIIKGDNKLTFTVPLTADTASQTFARFRFSSQGGLPDSGLAYDGEVEDYEVEIIGYDFGDAPDNLYPTLLADSGAYHKIKPGFFLGDSIDAEADGQTDDNAFNARDEDGVIFNTQPLIIGGKAQITVIASDKGMLDAWIDFNSDGDWKDDGEQIFDTLIVQGKNTLTFTVPDTADTAAQKTFARFRFSEQGGLSFDGYADNGEVEDYPVEIIAADFGDAPDDSDYHYATLLDNNGAHHKIKPGFHLGAGVDFEGDGKPNRIALGDSLDDGVVFGKMPMILSRPDTIKVIASDAGKLYAWIDSDCDGNWVGSNKQIFNGLPLAKGTTTHLTYTVPGGTNPLSHTYMRFRFSSMDSLTYDGFAIDGEVEDYQVDIIGYDFGDAPDPYDGQPGRYPTLLEYDGAYHQIDSRLYIGDRVDSDADGQPTTSIIELMGDDTDLEGDDEDAFEQDTLVLKICTYPLIKVKVHNSTGKKALLVGWIDFDGRLGWTENEKDTAIVESVGDTTAFLYFGKIRSYWKEITFARIRISTNIDSVDRPWGFAPDGEVEDYLVNIIRPSICDLASFEAVKKKGQVLLNWVTKNEPFNEQFIIYRSQNDSTDFVKINPEIIPSNGNSVTGAAYQFIDEPDEIGTYYYKLESVSPDSYSTFHGPITVNLMTTAAMVREALIPKEYSLSQNYPNPFNPETHIKYAIPKEGDVTIEIYDVLGRLVRKLVNEHKPAGYYQAIWNARNDDGMMVSNGIYLVRMKSRTFTSIKKMTLLK